MIRHGVPKGLTDVLPLDNTLFNGAMQAFASFLLIPVVTGAIEETVSRLERIINGLRP